ncbi:hypothetical protein EBT31_00645 [bacterium]|nr:hypothetical protein [bacterium]
MPARKTADADASVTAKKPSADPALPGKEIRDLAFVASEIRRLREEEGMNNQAIHEALQVSYDVINQLFLQSYKMTMNTQEVFEAQEKLRLGIE